MALTEVSPSQGHGASGPRAILTPLVAEPHFPTAEPPRQLHATQRRGHRLRIGAICFAAVMLVIWGILSDLNVRADLRTSRSSLVAESSRLNATLRALFSSDAKLASTTSARDTLQVTIKLLTWELSSANASLANTQKSLADASGSLASTQSSLANANANLFFEGTTVTALNQCLAGVEQALNQIAVGNQSGAVKSVSAVASSCRSAQSGGGGGPVSPFDFPDPDVIRVGSTYFAYGTNSGAGNVQVLESTDLKQWAVLGDALPRLPSWARPDGTWAPGVVALNGAYFLYYTTTVASSGRHCISVAAADQPNGPFVDSTTRPLVCQTSLGGSIDPGPFVDVKGVPYLSWKSQGAGSAPAIWVQQLSQSGTSLVGAAPSLLIRPSQTWEGGIVEGPAMLVDAGHYYLFYSANNWNGGKYAIGVALCQGATGPCTKPLDHPVLSGQAQFSGPGGPALFTDGSGGQWMAFHAYVPPAVGYPNSRLLFIRQVKFAFGIPVVQPST